MIEEIFAMHIKALRHATTCYARWDLKGWSEALDFADQCREFARDLLIP